MATAQRRYELRDDEWERIKKYFENEQPKGKGRPPSEARTVLNGIMWVVKSGAPWRDMPERYGKLSTVYGWFARWQEEGLLAQILADLSIDADPQDMSTDSTCAKVHQHAAGAKRGLQKTQPKTP